MSEFLENQKKKAEAEQKNLQTEESKTQPHAEVTVNEGPQDPEIPSTPPQPEGARDSSNDEERARELEAEQRESRWEPYEKTGTLEARPYEPDEDLSGITVSEGQTPEEGDMIARDIENPDDQWLIKEEFFHRNYTPLFGIEDDDDEDPYERIDQLEEDKRVLTVKVQNQNRTIQQLRANLQVGNR